MEVYDNEIERLIYEFNNKFNIDNTIDDLPILFEHKLNINNPASVLSQAIKYLSKIRNLGRLLPEKIIGIDLQKEKAYIWNSIDYLNDIEKQYVGAASKNNSTYFTNKTALVLDYSDRKEALELQLLIDKALDDKNYTKYHIDITNVIALSKEYYKVNASKDDFLDGPDAEIRNPKVLNDRIIPYEKPDNLEFSSIMDCLNTNFQQIQLGAYYTPDYCVKESQKMLISVIEDIKKRGLDYIVVDRCCGTGNLFEGLPDDILENCVLSTLEVNEYLILQEKFSTKATLVVPPTDALSYDIIPTEVDGNGNVISDYIRDKVNDPNCAVILYENPPYSEAGGATIKGDNSGAQWKKTFASNAMKEKIKGVATNDLSNLFIWSAFEYYLKKPFDHYLVYSPIKYWKQQHLVDRFCVDAFVCNRKDFHASPGAIACVLWKNEFSNQKEITGRVLNEDMEIIIKKVENLCSKAYDKRKFDDDTEDGIHCESSGVEFDKTKGRQIRTIPVDNPNIIAYLNATGFDPDAKHVSLTIRATAVGNGFHLRNDNYLEKLPLFVASLYYEFMPWYEKGIICKTYDGNGSYVKDKEFLKKCLIYTALSPRNKCRSLIGSNNKFYRNELCFDVDTLARNELSKFPLTKEEQQLIEQYDFILQEAKKCEEYNPDYTYGFFQIQEELNIVLVLDEHKEYKYPVLNGALSSLKIALKQYYINNLKDALFKYELLK